MKKYLHILAKVIFTLIVIMPVLGVTGIFPEPTRNLYNTDEAFAFIQMLYVASYVMYMLAVVHVLAVLALWTKREALGALLVLPITFNVVGFHLVLDGGLFTGGAVLADLMLLLNVYLLWKNRETLKVLIKQKVG